MYLASRKITTPLSWQDTFDLLPNECCLNTMNVQGVGEETSLANLIFNKVGRVLKLHFFSSQWVVMSGQSQTSQCVATTTPIPNDGHDLLLNSRGHRYFCTSNSNVGTPVNDTFRSTLEKRYRFRSTILFTGSSRILILARTSQL